jgi:hypothetical protein
MTRITQTLLIIPLGLSALACELSNKNLSDATADDTGAPGTTAGEGGATTGVNMAAPDTLEPETAGETGDPLVCDDPTMFPGVSKACSVDADCAVVLHQTDCCGTLAAVGVEDGSVDAFNEHESMCAALWPACECAAGPTSTEDGGTVPDPASAEAACVEGLCQSRAPEAGPLQWYTTCGDPVCGGYTPPDGVPPCTQEQLEGDPCEVEGTTCDPMSDCNALLICATKDPKQNEGGCPISRAKFKTDIEYLAPADHAQYAADLQSLRLATYRYRSAPADAPARLGIILEDNEQGIWVDAQHDRVDLYGYASLAIATLQLQQRQIAALQAEVERLSAQANVSPMCGP